MRFLLRGERGSALVETIGVMALLGLLVVGLIQTTLVIKEQSVLSHAAAISARSGAVVDQSAAEVRVHQLVGERVNAAYETIVRDGITYFEVRLTKQMLTLIGWRGLEGIGHAVVEK